nr:GNAT family N-acetyltransferase [Fictibacillus nanhaiensis]
MRLEKMNAEEFQRYLSFAIKTFADEQITSGNWEPQEAIRNAKKEFEKLLPEGQNTENHNLFIIRVGDKEVGVIWLATKTDEKGFIYDITIWDEYQGKGYGKKTMKEIETFAKENGIKSIGLHVFGQNKVARDLYEKLGYKETNIKMEKTL